MKRIGEYMTRQPWSIQIDDSIGLARQMMAHKEIHHLPVLDGKVLVGVVTDRDLAEASRRPNASVQQSVTLPGFQADLDTPLEDVLQQMIERRSDSVVITSRGEVAGIFTARDAVRVLRDTLRHRA